jgi:hypothetical protein
MAGLRRIGPNVLAVVVHGSSLFFMIVGLVRNAWYGYAFALIYMAAVVAFFVVIRRVRRRAELEFRKMRAERSRDPEP